MFETKQVPFSDSKEIASLAITLEIAKIKFTFPNKISKSFRTLCLSCRNFRYLQAGPRCKRVSYAVIRSINMAIYFFVFVKNWKYFVLTERFDSQLTYRVKFRILHRKYWINNCLTQV